MKTHKHSRKMEKGYIFFQLLMEIRQNKRKWNSPRNGFLQLCRDFPELINAHIEPICCGTRRLAWEVETLIGSRLHNNLKEKSLQTGNWHMTANLNQSGGEISPVTANFLSNGIVRLLRNWNLKKNYMYKTVKEFTSKIKRKPNQPQPRQNSMKTNYRRAFEKMYL